MDNPLNKPDEKASSAINETVQGLILLDTHLIVYGQFAWVVFDMSGKELSRHRRRRGASIYDVHRNVRKIYYGVTYQVSDSLYLTLI